MPSSLPLCPSCGSKQVVKHGSIHTGKQNHKCKACGRQFVKHPENKIINAATKQLIDKLLLEKLPLAGIARVTDVSEPWLQNYVNHQYANVPRQLTVSPKQRVENHIGAIWYLIHHYNASLHL